MLLVFAFAKCALRCGRPDGRQITREELVKNKRDPSDGQTKVET